MGEKTISDSIPALTPDFSENPNIENLKSVEINERSKQLNESKVNPFENPLIWFALSSALH